MVLELLLSLSQLLDPSDDGSLRDDLILAAERPADYLAKHPEMRERMMNNADPAANGSLPWLALVDGLMARGYATELDYKTTGTDAAASLEHLKGHTRFSRKTRDWLKTLGPEGMTTASCLRRVAAHAAFDGVVVAVMDIDSDSYIVLILGKDDYKKATRFAEQLGYILKDIREHDPNE
jgi:hypothetical protein